MKEYYYSKLGNREQRFYKSLLDAMREGCQNAKAPLFMNGDGIAKVVTAIAYDHPELYFVDFQHLDYAIMPTGNVCQIKYIIRPSLRHLLDGELNKRVAHVMEAASRCNLRGELETIRWIHDYLVKHVRYHNEALQRPDDYPDAFGIKGVFIDGVAVCEGVAKAFKLMCDRLGVEALLAHGLASQEMYGSNLQHAWNIVKIGSDYAHVDVTWDMGMSEECRFPRYDYFCIPDVWMGEDHTYDSYPPCNTAAYSFFKRRHRIFSRARDLKVYLDKSIQEGSKTLYFKVEAPKKRQATIGKTIQEQVRASVHAYCPNESKQYVLETVENKSQMCFFIRIRW